MTTTNDFIDRATSFSFAARVLFGIVATIILAADVATFAYAGTTHALLASIALTALAIFAVAQALVNARIGNPAGVIASWSLFAVGFVGTIVACGLAVTGSLR